LEVELGCWQGGVFKGLLMSLKRQLNIIDHLGVSLQHLAGVA
jgi:hypothetical protein